MDKILQILNLLLGGSKWTMVIAVLAVAGMAVYGISTINDLQAKLTITTQNYNTAKQNEEKLNNSIKVQKETISRLENLVNLSKDISKDLVKNMNDRSKQLNDLRLKLNTLLSAKVQKDIIKKPTEYEQKINDTMLSINKCFEELSKEDFSNDTIVTNKEEAKVNEPTDRTKVNETSNSNSCYIEPVPNFPNGVQ